MADKLLIRTYDVDVGDCIYCRIPNARPHENSADDFHLLIDCGSRGRPESPLNAAAADLREMLPDAPDGRKRLDLLVVTHEHEDHIAGFDPRRFAGIRIENLWMSAAMNPSHPQAGHAHRLHAAATTAMRNIAAMNLALSPELENLVALYGIGNDGAVEALRETLPRASGIVPRYVHAGMDSRSLELPLTGATIHVLNPEQDIDRFYLGERPDDTLRALADGAAFRAGPRHDVVPPANISGADFRQLQSRMLSSAFGFADLDSKVINNTSVVLLIEWGRRRLLFVGDAEWDSGFRDGKSNGAWNLMWARQHERLAKPVDFLKIGHHGSENATPWDETGVAGASEPALILDAILPRPPALAAPTARAVVSTKRKNYETIPSSALLTEIGTRVANTRNYAEALGARASDLPKYDGFERRWLDRAQPWRTDCEHMLSGSDFVDVEIDP